MNYAIIYYSHFGNGKRIVERMAESLRAKGEVRVLTLAEADPKALPQADAYVFSAPVEAFSIYRPMKRFLKEMEVAPGKRCALINTHASRKSRLPKMEELAKAKGMVVAGTLDIQVVGNYKTGNALPEGWEKRADEFAGKL